MNNLNNSVFFNALALSFYHSGNKPCGADANYTNYSKRPGHLKAAPAARNQKIKYKIKDFFFRFS